MVRSGKEEPLRMRRKRRIGRFSGPSSLPMMMAAAVMTSYLLTSCSALAYAPNFITKNIQEQTGRVPHAQHLEVVTDEEAAHSDSATTTTTTTTTTATKPGALVRTRFPPEPNGYLHIGHAKAVCFNHAVANMFADDNVPQMHLRMDDTNPVKETEEYANSIIQDVAWILRDDTSSPQQPWSGPVRKTSDYFDFIHDCAVSLIKSGRAYVDSLSAAEMKDYRGTLTEPGRESPYRSRSTEENLQLFADMKAGRCRPGEHVLRAKIDMASPNLNLRDPTLYRVVDTADNVDGWHIYPMYDFSHPIADAVEGITFSLCTLEFEDHRPLYDWTIQSLVDTGMLPYDAQQPILPQQMEFSRLNLKSTVLSKRKLIQLVQQPSTGSGSDGKNIAPMQGWDDPRLPTISGMRRRGVPAAALRLLCQRVGISKADSNIDYSVLEDCTRTVLDDSVPRAFCVLEPLKVTLTNYESNALEELVADRHPKRGDMGTRTIPFGKSVFIERSDFYDADGPEGKAGAPPKGFKRLLPGGRVRLRYAYVIECEKVIRDAVTGEPIELLCSYYPETRGGVTPDGMKRVKGIIHWVEASTAVRCTINQYDRLFLTEEPGKESGGFMQDLNPQSLQIFRNVVVEPSVAADAQAKLDDIAAQEQEEDVDALLLNRIYPSSLAYQFERTGYFALDESSTDKNNLVFNRVATLRDTWDVQKKDERKQPQRKRGTGGGSNKDNKGPVEDVRRVAFRAATILSAEPHPEADSLIVCQVDCGDVSETDGESSDPRTVVAGLAGKIPIDELVGSKIVAVTNLKPAKMRGIASTAMLLAATNGKDGDDEIVELLSVPDEVPNGELIRFDGKEENEPDAMMKSKGALKAFDRAKAGLQTNGNGEAMFIDASGSSHRMITSAGPIRVKSLVNADIS